MQCNPAIVEHRCACGKLLFKGNIAIGFLEIKCKHCGQIKIFENSLHALMPSDSYALIFDDRGFIQETSLNAHYILGYKYPELLQMRIQDIAVGDHDNLMDKALEGVWSMPDAEKYYFQYELRIKTKDGGILSNIIRWKTMPNKERRAVAYLYVHPHLPPQSRAANEFRLARRYPSFTATIDGSGNCTVGAAHARFLGIPRHTHLTFPDMFANIDMHKEIRRLLSRGSNFSFKDVHISYGVANTTHNDIRLLANSDSKGILIDYTAYFTYHPT